MRAPKFSARILSQRQFATLLLAGLCLVTPASRGGAVADPPGLSRPGRIVTRYALTSSHDSSINDPKAWRLLGSNDGGQSWTVLDVQTNQQFLGRSQRRLYPIANRILFRCYRLQVDQCESSDLDIYYNSSVQLAELELLGPVVGAVSEADLQCVITSSDAHPLLGPAENAFDNDLTTRWLDLALWHRKPCWIQCEYVASREVQVTNISRLQSLGRLASANGALWDRAPVVWSNLHAQAKLDYPTLTGYALTSANDVPERDPHDWRLLGSKDGGKTWETLDARQGELFTSRFQRRVFQLTNAAAAALYRLEIQATRAPENIVQLAEIEPLHAKPGWRERFSLVVAARSDNPQVEAVDMAFDCDPNTKWLSFSQVTPQQSCWAQWQYVPAEEEQPVINQHAIDRYADQLRLANLMAHAIRPLRTLKGYALTSANDHPERDPTAWRLLGSNDDGKSWKTLDVRHSELFPARFQRRVFMLPREATFATYGFQVDSVANPATANSVQLAQLEPLFAETYHDPVSVVISAQGENPPLETAENLFGAQPNTKWLDFADADTNRTSWVQWFYASGQDLPVVCLDRLKKAQSPARQRYWLDLRAVVVAYGISSNLVALVDESGFQWVHLGSDHLDLQPGERIRLSGQLRFGGQIPTLLEPSVTHLGPLPEGSLLSAGNASSAEPNFFVATLQGRATAVWQERSFIGLDLALDNNRGSMVARLLDRGPLPFAGPLDCRLQARGVVEAVYNEKGEKVPGVIWLSTLDDLALAAPTEKEWRSWPEWSIATLCQTNPAPGQLVRVRGKVAGIEPGRGLLLGDGTNAVLVYSQQAGAPPAGTPVEAVGFLARTNDRPALWLAYSRVQGQRAAPDIPGEEAGAGSSGPLTEIHKVREFIRAHPTGDCPVRVRGVITYVDVGVSDFFLCDGVESLEVSGQVGAGLSPFLQQEGMFVELNGLVHNGNVYAREFVHFLGQGQSPTPVRHSWQYLMSGKADDQWVEVEGVVASVEKQRLTLLVDGNQILAWVSSLGKSVPGTFLGSRVRARGVCSAVLNSRSQRLGLRLLVPSWEQVQVVQAAPENPFALATVRLASLAQANAETTRLVKTEGTVTYSEPRIFFLQDQTNGLRVFPQQDSSLEPGDLAEVVGLVEPDGLSSKLVQAHVRKVGHARLPPARPVQLSSSDAREQQEDCDGLRVQMDATLLSSGLKDSRQVLELQFAKSQRTFWAFAPAASPFLADAPPGSRVRIQGVFQATTTLSEDFEQTVTSFELYLNGPADVQVLARPSWWTPGRLAGTLSGALAASAVVLAWGLMISRKNKLLHQAQTEMQLAQDRLERRVEERTHELANSFSLLNATLDSTADGILVVDLQGAITSYNTKFAQMWNLSRAVLESTDDARLLTLVTGQLKNTEGFLARIRELYASPEAVSFDTLEFKDGRVFERYSQAQRLDNRCVGRVWCFRDVTARVRAEAELAFERDLLMSLLDNLPDLIYFKDRQSRFVRVGKAKLQESFRLAGHRHPVADPDPRAAPLPAYLADLEQFNAWLMGKTDFDLYPDERARSAYEDEQEILRTGNPLIGKIERTALADGSVSWLLTTKMLWRDPSGNVIGTFGTSKDITPIKEAEAKLETLHQQLVEVSRQAGMAEVATSVLHNVGNVLNSVNVATSVLLSLTQKSSASQIEKLAALLEEHRGDLAEYLAREGRADQVISYLRALAQQLASHQAAMLKELQDLSGNVDHIKEIVSRQQSYARVSGVLELHSVSDLLEDALRMQADSLARHDVQVVRQFDPVPELVLDKHKILQILVNLISNAKDALSDHPTEGRRLILRVGMRDESCVRISVADNGRGVDPQNATRIFAHGFTTKKDGHGFGLHSGAITAREMGGSLQLHSEGAGKGATFTLELPLSRKHPVEPKPT